MVWLGLELSSATTAAYSGKPAAAKVPVTNPDSEPCWCCGAQIPGFNGMEQIPLC